MTPEHPDHGNEWFVGMSIAFAVLVLVIILVQQHQCAGTFVRTFLWFACIS